MPKLPSETKKYKKIIEKMPIETLRTAMLREADMRCLAENKLMELGGRLGENGSPPETKSDQLTIRCNCFGHHWLHLEYFTELDYNEFYVSFIDEGNTIWERLYQAIRHVFNRNQGIYFSSIIIADKDLEKIEKFIVEYKSILKQQKC